MRYIILFVLVLLCRFSLFPEIKDDKLEGYWHRTISNNNTHGKKLHCIIEFQPKSHIGNLIWATSVGVIPDGIFCKENFSWNIENGKLYMQPLSQDIMFSRDFIAILQKYGLEESDIDILQNIRSEFYSILTNTVRSWEQAPEILISGDRMELNDWTAQRELYTKYNPVFENHTANFVKSDKSTERKLHGRWTIINLKSVLFFDKIPDNIEFTNIIDLDAISNKIACHVNIVDTDGLSVNVRINGKWKATKDRLYYEFDLKSIDLKFSGKRIQRAEIGNGLEEFMKILSIDNFYASVIGNRIKFANGGFNIVDFSGDETLYRPITIAQQEEEKVVGHSMLEYEGKIGKYPIGMVITKIQLDTGNVEGKYRYLKSGSGTWLMVHGRINASTGGYNIELYEQNEKGNQTGIFNGYMDSNGLTINGEFINYKGTKFDFELNKK